jgi:hypothetical protein
LNIYCSQNIFPKKVKTSGFRNVNKNSVFSSLIGMSTHLYKASHLLLFEHFQQVETLFSMLLFLLLDQIHKFHKFASVRFFLAKTAGSFLRFYQKMNDFSKLCSSSSNQRLNSHITVVAANCRTFDHRVKLEIHQRRLTQHFTATEKNLRRIQKWDFRAEKNKIMKDIAQNRSNEQLTPSVDEWLKMNKNEKRRNSILVNKNSIC